jgi:hypothetical protein
MRLMRPFSALLLTGVLIGTMSGCGPQLRALSDRPVNLSGRWQMVDGEHQRMLDNLRDAIEQAQAKEERRERRRRRGEAPPEGDDSPPESPSVNSPPANDQPVKSSSEGAAGAPRSVTPNWQERERRDQVNVLLAMVVPATFISITQPSEEEVLIKPDGGAQRRLDTRDGSTLVNQFATLAIRSGWQGDRFVIYSTDRSQGLEVTESYQRSGNQLKVTVLFKMDSLKLQTLTTSYQLS